MQLRAPQWQCGIMARLSFRRKGNIVHQLVYHQLELYRALLFESTAPGAL
jgi:hypothetical protein